MQEKAAIEVHTQAHYFGSFWLFPRVLGSRQKDQERSEIVGHCIIRRKRMYKWWWYKPFIIFLVLALAVAVGLCIGGYW